MKTPFQGSTITTVGERKQKITGANFDAKSLPYILDALTDMYPNLDLAILREYSTNALDSHISAGVTRPIEVTLPSEHDLHLRIQDFGLGMDEDAMDKYVSYGYSTKRDSNKVLGNKGLGSKSALAAIDSFRLIAVKDGVRRIGMVEKDAEGVGQIRFMSEKPTDESNGVTVIIPVPESSIDSYAEQAAYAYQLWEDGTVLVNGRKPETVVDRGYQRAGELGYVAHNSRSYRADIKVNMGGLLYKVDGLDYAKREELFRGAKPLATKDFIVNVEIGSVKVAPNRESIVSNTQGLRVVGKAIKELYTYLMAHAQDEIDAAPNAFAAMQIIDTFSFLNDDSFTYKGEKYLNTFDALSLETYRWETEQGRRKKHSAHGEKLWMPVNHKASPSLVIDTHKSVTPSHKIVSTLNTIRKMYDDYAVKRNFVVGDFSEATKGNIFTQAMIENGLFKVLPADKLMEDVAAFRKANRARGNSGGARGAIVYPVYTHDGEDADGDNATSREDLTISEIRDLDGTVYIHHLPNGQRDSYVTAPFRKYGKKGEMLVVVAPGRAVETLEKRIGKHVTVKHLATVLAPRIRAKLTEPVPSRLHGIFSGYRSDSVKKFFTHITSCGVEIASPLIQEAANYDPNDVNNTISDNGYLRRELEAVGVFLSEDERTKFLTHNGNNGGDNAFKAFWGTYQIVRELVDEWNPSERSIKYAAMLANQVFETEGDPVL